MKFFDNATSRACFAGLAADLPGAGGATPGGRRRQEAGRLLGRRRGRRRHPAGDPRGRDGADRHRQPGRPRRRSHQEGGDRAGRSQEDRPPDHHPLSRRPLRRPGRHRQAGAGRDAVRARPEDARPTRSRRTPSMPRLPGGQGGQAGAPSSRATRCRSSRPRGAAPLTLPVPGRQREVRRRQGRRGPTPAVCKDNHAQGSGRRRDNKNSVVMLLELRPVPILRRRRSDLEHRGRAGLPQEPRGRAGRRLPDQPPRPRPEQQPGADQDAVARR